MPCRCCSGAEVSALPEGLGCRNDPIPPGSESYKSPAVVNLPIEPGKEGRFNRVITARTARFGLMVTLWTPFGGHLVLDCTSFRRVDNTSY